VLHFGSLEGANDFIIAVLNEVNRILINSLNVESFTHLQRGWVSANEKYINTPLNFDLRRYVKAQLILGGKIASGILTVEGIKLARQLKQKYDR
jgi:hypothetical protein